MKLGVAAIGCLISALLTAVAPTPAGAKTLEWRLLAVNARLEADGRLHVREEQAIVFTGDWNGAQRVFRLAPGQKIQLTSVSRIGDGGEVIPLVRGDLNQVNHYDWVGSNTLRWRGRRPEDPPFAATEITYVLDYTLSNILVPQANDREFRLDHDFAFAQREGPIHEFTLALELDPVWRPLRGNFSGQYARGPLPPGESFVLGVPLRYLGGGRPAAVWYGASPRFRNALAIFLLLAVALASLRYLAHERALGRFTPLTPVSAIDDRWLDEHVFTYKPEVVGAAFDHTTSAPEVGAVIARMMAEGKIKSRVEAKRRGKEALHLELAAERDDLQGYEKTLVDALFFDGPTTDTERIKRHYRKSGFDPAEKIRAPIEGIVRGFRGPALRSRELAVWPSILLLIAGAAGLIAAVILRPNEAAMTIPILFAGTLIGIFLCILGYSLRQRSDAVPVRTWALLTAVLALATAGAAVVASGGVRPSPIVLAAFAIYVYGLCRLVLTIATSREQSAALAIRRNFAAARNYFAQELRERAPRLKDDWIPYLIALGLGPHLDRWFRAFGDSKSGAVATSTASMGSGGHGGSSGSSGGGWTGGGGSFGGAGATASWSAMGTMAAGVPSPSSSSSGGGSSGGGSSGGGGGGGW